MHWLLGSIGHQHSTGLMLCNYFDTLVRAANQYGTSVFCMDFTCKIREYEFGFQNTEIDLCQFCHLRYYCQNKAYLFWVANQSRFVVFYALKPSNTSLITKTFILLSSTCNSNTCSSSLPVPVVPLEFPLGANGSHQSKKIGSCHVMTVLSLMRNRLRDTEKLSKIRKYFQQNAEVFWRLAALLSCFLARNNIKSKCSIYSYKCVLFSWTLRLMPVVPMSRPWRHSPIWGP